MPGLAIPPWLEALLLLAIVIVAACVRFVDLSAVPPGLHGDEAVTGLEGRRILAEGWIGPYSPGALGQPTGPLYLTAVSLRLFGETVFALRFVPALLGTATVIALYVVLRRNVDTPTALAGVGLLAVMSWHVHFSRIGFPLAAWPLVVVLAAGALLEAVADERPGWWAAAGALAGVGIYVYNAHPLYLGVAAGFALYSLFRWDVLATIAATVLYAVVPSPFVLLALIFAVVRLLSSPRLADSDRVGRLLAFAGGLGAIVLPMVRFAADERTGYFEHARQYAIVNDPAWGTLRTAADRVEFLAGRYVDFWDRVCCDPRLDGVDGTGVTPIVPVPFLALAAAGLGLALWRQREPWAVLGAITVAVMPLGAVLTVEGLARRTFAMTPFLAAFAGYGVVAMYRAASVGGAAARFAAAAGVLMLTGWAVYESVRDEMLVFPRSPEAAWVFAREMADAAAYIDALPPGHHVYFLSDRWSVNYETRQFLAPDASVEDRSREFGRFDLGFDPEKGVPVFVLVGAYKEMLPRLEALYPGRETVPESGWATASYVAYLPAPGAVPGPGDPPSRASAGSGLTD